MEGVKSDGDAVTSLRRETVPGGDKTRAPEYGEPAPSEDQYRIVCIVCLDALRSRRQRGSDDTNGAHLAKTSRKER